MACPISKATSIISPLVADDGKCAALIPAFAEWLLKTVQKVTNFHLASLKLEWRANWVALRLRHNLENSQE